MGRIIRTVLIAAITVVLLIVGAFLIAANFSGVAQEYACDGETRWTDDPPQKDPGRLRVEEYRWWVGLWSDSHGSAVFESKKIGRFVSLNLKKSDQGNFSLYIEHDPNQEFWFRRSTGELGIRRYPRDSAAGYTFVGECKEDKEAQKSG